jgi:site-specific recombinase XerC
MSPRQLSRLLKEWVIEAGLGPSVYSIESLHRTKALHISKGTGDSQTVPALLGHVQIESTARCLALKTKLSHQGHRAFDMYDSAYASIDTTRANRSGRRLHR